jgi:hypothetical protein
MLGSSAAAWPLAARAQQSKKVPRLCFLTFDRRMLQWRARQDILDATPRNIGAPERAARQCMPRDLYA